MPPLSSSEVLPDFPQPFGNRMVSIVDHKGPTSYTQVSAGTVPPTGGDKLTAAECGLKFISSVNCQLSDDGTYEIDASMGANQGGETTSVVLIWAVAHTGAEAAAATNLSARSVRIFVIGR